MKFSIKKMTIGTLFSSLFVIATSLVAADDKGCWSGQHSNGPCLEYSSYIKNNKTYVELTNICTDRLYMKWCVGNKCGADGLRGGQTKKKYEYITNARVQAWAIGSNRSSSDWTCKSRMGGW